ncbi:MAG: DUF427 domain-containing protein [Pseudomonadota bacterium]
MGLPRENVQDYPRPPALKPVSETLRVVLGGVDIVCSSNGYRVLETHHAPTYYIPPGDVLDGALVSAPGSSFCEWKGRAHYFDVVGGSKVQRRAAWAYARPTPGFAAIRDFIAFYPGLMDACFVGDEQVTPQPGDFYGGWVTDNLDGIVKGAPGTRHW